MSHLPTFATSWQHESQIESAIFFAKNHKIVSNSATTELKEKISADPEILRIFDVSLIIFKNNQILIN
jgi:hypothetical protein